MRSTMEVQGGEQVDIEKVIATIAQRKRKGDALPPRRNVASRIEGGFLPPINKL